MLPYNSLMVLDLTIYIWWGLITAQSAKYQTSRAHSLKSSYLKYTISAQLTLRRHIFLYQVFDVRVVRNCWNCFQHMFWCCFLRFGTFHQSRFLQFVTRRFLIRLKFCALKAAFWRNSVIIDLLRGTHWFRFLSKTYLTMKYGRNWIFICCYQMFDYWQHSPVRL